MPRTLATAALSLQQDPPLLLGFAKIGGSQLHRHCHRRSGSGGDKSQAVAGAWEDLEDVGEACGMVASGAKVAAVWWF